MCIKIFFGEIYELRFKMAQNALYIPTALFVKTNEGIYFASFGIEHIPNEIKKYIGNNNIKSNIFRIFMRGYYCIEFINYMLKGKTLLDYTNLISPNYFKKNDQIIKRIFKK